ncbi:DUF58 domain-containing protein [Paenibacillus sp. TRM 82003]|nr:DUF58 domain-containing protein [Paenibacillus sp. TRM 82003]
MWIALWLLVPAALVSTWTAPLYWKRYVYPRIDVEAFAIDDIVDVGESVAFRCRFANPTRLPCHRVRIEWALPDQLRAGADRSRDRITLEVYLPPRQVTEATVTVHAVRRGIAAWTESEATFTDALGLHKAFRTVYPQGRTVVRPNRTEPLKLASPWSELLGELRARRYHNEDPALLIGTRPYQSGDGFRRISWRATARAGELMTKQFGHTTASKVQLLLNGQMSGELWRIAERDRLDAMCQRLVQLAATLLQSGAAVGLRTNLYDSVALTYAEPPREGAVQLERLANRMGSVSAQPMQSASVLLGSAAGEAASGDTVVFLTAYWDEACLRALADIHRKQGNAIVYYFGIGEPPAVPAGIRVIAERLPNGEGKGERPA